MQTNFPLLCKGFFSNANGTTGLSVTNAQLAANRGWTNQLPTGRGNLIAVDLIKSEVKTAAGISAPVTLSVGGIQVFTASSLNNYLLSARAASYLMAKLNQAEGQTLALTLGTGTVTGGAVVHGYFTNGWDQPEIWKAINTSQLKCRYQDLTFTAAGGSKGNSSGQLTVPTGKGNVVGIMPLSENDGVSDEPGTALFSVLANGVTILDNISGYLGAVECNRPGLIFPMVIQGGSTLEIQADTSNGVAGNFARFGVRLYFDDKINSTPYAPTC